MDALLGRDSRLGVTRGVSVMEVTNVWMQTVTESVLFQAYVVPQAGVGA